MSTTNNIILQEGEDEEHIRLAAETWSGPQRLGRPDARVVLRHQIGRRGGGEEAAHEGSLYRHNPA